MEPLPAVLAERIRALDRRIDERLCALDRRIDERLKATDAAMHLQAEKNEKHFDALNNEQARLLSDRERYLPRETYAVDRKDQVALWIAIVAIAVSALNGFMSLWKGP